MHPAKWRSFLRAAALTLAVCAALTASTVWALCAPTARGIFPASGIVGTTVTANVPGTGLTGATADVFGAPGLTVTVQSTGDTSVALQLVIDPAAEPGERIISLATPGGVVAVDFTVNGAAGPVVSGLTPTPLAVQGSPLSLTLAGQNLALVGMAELSVSGEGVTVTNAVAAGDGTSVDVTLDVAADAQPGTRALVVTTPLGGAVLQLYVQRPPPVVASVSPGAVAVGTAVPITITGSNLTGAALIVTGTTGTVTVSDVSTPDDATLTATLTVSGALSPEAEPRLLILTTESGQVTKELYIVAADVPSLTGIAPGAGSPDTRVPVRLRGLHLTGASISTASASLAIENVVVVDDETVDLEIVVAANAMVDTNHTLTATVGALTANTTFRVIATDKPFIGAVRPPFGNRGSTIRVTLEGVNLGTVVAGTGVSISGTKIGISNVTALDATSVQAVFVIEDTASIGGRDVTVTTATGEFKKSAAFRVNVPGTLPAVTDVTPRIVDPGTTTSITVTGSNLAGAGVTVGGDGATVSNIVANVDGTSVTFDLALASDAIAESRPVIVVTRDGTATCHVLSGAELGLSAAAFAATGSEFEVTTPGFRLFLFEFSINDRFDAGVRTFTVSSGTQILALTRQQAESIGRAVRDLPFGYVRARAVTATNLIGTSDPFRFRR